MPATICAACRAGEHSGTSAWRAKMPMLPSLQRSSSRGIVLPMHSKYIVAPRYPLSVTAGLQGRPALQARASAEESTGALQPKGHEGTAPWWEVAAKAVVFVAVVVALPLLSAPHAHARRRRQPDTQVAQAVPTQQQAGWHGEIGAQAQRRFLVPAAASMRGAGHAVREAAARAATATEHQAQETGHWIKSLGRGGAEPIAAMPAPRAADLRHRGHPVIVGVEPQSRGTVEHIQETLQSPAVRVVVMVGAVSVLLVILRTAMDTPTKKFSPLDSDDWHDREDQERDSNGTVSPAQSPDSYPRATAAFSGTAAATAADLAARVNAANAAAGKATTFPDPTAGTAGAPPAAAGVARNEEEKPSGTNAKLKAKLEEVRRSVAEAKAQVAAATGLGEARKQAARVQTQKQLLPVFQTAVLEGTPVDYQGKAVAPEEQPREDLPTADRPKAAAVEEAPIEEKPKSAAQERRETLPVFKAAVLEGAPTDYQPELTQDTTRSPPRSQGSDSPPRSQPPRAAAGAPPAPAPTRAAAPAPAPARSSASIPRPSFAPPAPARSAPARSAPSIPRPSFGPPKVAAAAQAPAPTKPASAPAPTPPPMPTALPAPEPISVAALAPPPELALLPAPGEGEATNGARGGAVDDITGRPGGRRREEVESKGRQAARETDEFLRHKSGAKAPAVVALSLFSSAANAFAPLVMSKEERRERAARAEARRAAWRESEAASAELDWARYGKYDALQELLRVALADRDAQEEARYSPVRVAMGMVPERGVAKYDALRQLLRGMLTADASAPEHDLVWDLLHSYRAKTESGEGEAETRFDPVYNFLNRAAAAADWGLPEEGPVAELLKLDAADWAPPAHCPVTSLLQSAKDGGAAPWHGNVRSKYDPATDLFNIQVPTGQPGFDPLPAALAAEEPKGRGWLDPVGNLFDFVKWRTSMAGLQEQLDVKREDPLEAALAQEYAAPGTGGGNGALVISSDTLFTPPTLADVAADPGSGAGAQPDPMPVAVMEQHAAASTAPAQGSQRRWVPAWFRRGQAAPAAAQAEPAVEQERGAPLTPIQPSGTARAAAQDEHLQPRDLVSQSAGGLAQALAGAPEQGAAARRAHDPTLDLLRLERGLGSPVAARQQWAHRAVMLRRSPDFDAVAAAFRVAVKDERLAQEHAPLFTLLHRAANPTPATNSSDPTMAMLKDFDEAAIKEAQRSMESFVAQIDRPDLAPLHGVLVKQQSSEALDTICALAAIVKPFRQQALSS